MTSTERWKKTGLACIGGLAAFLVLRSYVPANDLAARLTGVPSSPNQPFGQPGAPDGPGSRRITIGPGGRHAVTDNRGANVTTFPRPPFPPNAFPGAGTARPGAGSKFPPGPLGNFPAPSTPGNNPSNQSN